MTIAEIFYYVIKNIIFMRLMLYKIFFKIQGIFENNNVYELV